VAAIGAVAAVLAPSMPAEGRYEEHARVALGPRGAAGDLVDVRGVRRLLHICVNFKDKVKV
jgi:hypothetical protein